MYLHRYQLPWTFETKKIKTVYITPVRFKKKKKKGIRHGFSSVLIECQSILSHGSISHLLNQYVKVLISTDTPNHLTSSNHLNHILMASRNVANISYILYQCAHKRIGIMLAKIIPHFISQHSY